MRYDAVYGPLFRCSRARLADFPHLHAWLRDVARARGVRETVEVAPTTYKDMHKRPFLAASVRAAVAYKDMHKHQQNTP